MVKNSSRSAWNENEDIILAETVLRYIRGNGRLGDAFEEVANKTGRTSAGANFHWNSVLKAKYEAAIQIAKAQRLARNSGQTYTSSVSQPAAPTKVVGNTGDSVETFVANMQERLGQIAQPVQAITVAQIIDALHQFEIEHSIVEAANQTQSQTITRLQEDLAVANAKIQELEHQLKDEQAKQTVFGEDYKTLFQILDRARNIQTRN